MLSLKEQFLEIGELQPTLMQTRLQKQHWECNKNQIQIVHSRGDHCIVAATVQAENDEVMIQFIVLLIDVPTKSIISNLFPAATSIALTQVNRQKGGLDCCVFAIAISSDLALQ